MMRALFEIAAGVAFFAFGIGMTALFTLNVEPSWMRECASILHVVLFGVLGSELIEGGMETLRAGRNRATATRPAHRPRR